LDLRFINPQSEIEVSFMEKVNRQKILNLPNGVTIIRIAAIPIILLLLFTSGQTYKIITALLFLFVAGTDTLDGYLARRRGMVTTLGKFLDPLADKLLIVTALIALIPAREIPFWMVIVIVGREIAVTGLRGIAVSQDIVISASALGKYKTVFEVVSISFLIFDGNLFSIDFHQVGMVLLWVAMGIAVISGIDYFNKFLKSIVV
jgi:CDP-diacylglycerol--glycerol-3-phosphate 3-phosphatidyltransferase